VQFGELSLNLGNPDNVDAVQNLGNQRDHDENGNLLGSSLIDYEAI
jgi:hypothetical protein